MKAFEVVPNRADFDVHLLCNFFARDSFEKQPTHFLLALGDPQEKRDLFPLSVVNQMESRLIFPLPGVVVQSQNSPQAALKAVSVPVLIEAHPLKILVVERCAFHIGRLGAIEFLCPKTVGSVTLTIPTVSPALTVGTPRVAIDERDFAAVCAEQ